MIAPSSGICLLGLGEVGTILADELTRRGFALSAWDVAFAQAGSRPAQAAAARALRRGCDARDAARGAQVVISAVTAAQTTAAARAVAPALGRGAWYMDLNSASPASKREAAQLVAAHGGRYVEVAVMGAFPPSRMAVPMLIGGPHAADFLPVVEQLGFGGAACFSAEYGPAAAVKMCRSVVVKGLEALLAEALVAARAHGVDEAVLDSLDNVIPGVDWPALSRYMISRSLEHGTRRAEELREAAKTVAEAGLAPLVSTAVAERQDWAGRFADQRSPDLEQMLDAIRARMKAHEETTAG